MIFLIIILIFMFVSLCVLFAYLYAYVPFGVLSLSKRLRAFLSLFRKSKKHKKKHFHTELTPTHGDLVPQNILVSGADIRLID